MKVNSKKIELFKDLSQFDLDNVYYDFHNDFDCIKIVFEGTFILLLFRKIIEGYIISFKFDNVILVSFEFENFNKIKNLTIDNIYRGRFEKDRQLIEFSSDGKSYFYLEFVEGIRMELWCDYIVIEKTEV